MAVNKALITIVGQAGRDPQIKFTKNGRAWVKFPVAVTERTKGDNGQWEDGQTDWYEVVAWAGLAEGVAENVRKGTTVVVEGRFKREGWTGKDGQARVNLLVNADNVGIVPRGKPQRQLVADDNDFGVAPF